MNKKDLVDLVAQKTSQTKVQAAAAIDATFQAISEGLAKGDSFNIIGFGKFEVRHRKERKGRNPASGENFTIPPTSVVAFRVGKNLKDDVAGKVTN